ncbi:cytochrome c oxidase subunit 3 [Candidatus Methylospira mobilis]|uniref:cytochrome-c oxidase n=1 Tax=Candidatus Methylospira mobilis TaxID=1808979 RepID=A0A5Q0BK21_9GAMM|nr:cytochrome c oxidase subunit 3 [Candidatus Methylospira mobilis]QFY42508.1 cytochrome c oxidase subunit 3 [Candidatus Methylospira mobilis]
MATKHAYYVPHEAKWPIVGSIGLTTLMVGFANLVNGSSVGSTMMVLGAIIMVIMLFGWFGTVISESVAGSYSHQVDVSFRMGMMWFIFSEVMFFSAFFGALYYTRIYSIPWLAGGLDYSNGATHELWTHFKNVWPTNGPGEVGGHFEPMGAWGIPFLNTLILLSSGGTVTWAHWGLLDNNRPQLIKGLAATVVLGFSFVALQAVEYHEAYTEMGLTLGSGIYGSTFFMLTGFHGLHVTIGAIFLTVVLLRSIKGHFSEHNHFAFEAAAWYWHFVDVVWLGLFIFVYWL